MRDEHRMLLPRESNMHRRTHNKRVGARASIHVILIEAKWKGEKRGERGERTAMYVVVLYRCRLSTDE